MILRMNLSYIFRSLNNSAIAIIGITCLYSCVDVGVYKYQPTRVGSWEEVSYVDDSLISKFIVKLTGDYPFAFDIGKDGNVAMSFIRLEGNPPVTTAQIFTLLERDVFQSSNVDGFLRSIQFINNRIASVVENKVVWLTVSEGDTVEMEQTCSGCGFFDPTQVREYKNSLLVYEWTSGDIYACSANGVWCVTEYRNLTSVDFDRLNLETMPGDIVVIPHSKQGVYLLHDGQLLYRNYFFTPDGKSHWLGKYVATARSSRSIMFLNAVVSVDSSLNLIEHKLNKNFPEIDGSEHFDVDSTNSMAFVMHGSWIVKVDSSGYRDVWIDSERFKVPNAIYQVGIRISESTGRIVALVPGGVIRGDISSMHD